jgi:GNAT superfamily N-acetyltransferase
MVTTDLVEVGAADAGALIELARAFHAEHGYTLSERSMAGLLLVAQGHPLARAWLALEDGRAVGYAVLARGFAADHGGPIAVLDDLYVTPAARGRAVGAMLAKRVEHEARDMGLTALLVLTDPANGPAMRFYGARGFAPLDGLMLVKPLPGRPPAAP